MLYIFNIIKYSESVPDGYKAHRSEEASIFLVTGTQSSLSWQYKFHIGDWVYYSYRDEKGSFLRLTNPIIN